MAISARLKESRAWVPRTTVLVIAGLITLHDAQQKIDQESKRFNVVACGRRWGKTRYGVYRACLRLAITSSLVGWFAPTYKYLNEAWDELYEKLTDSDAIASSNKTERIIRLKNGSSIEFWTMDDPDCGRSRKYHLVIIDEAAKQEGLKGIWEKAIAPTLADFVGEAWFLSTPRGSKGFFFEGFRNGQSGLDGEWASWQMPTTTNPYIKQSEIDGAERRSTPLVFKQEWLAEFVQPAGAVFDCWSFVENVVKTRDIPDEWKLYAGWDFGSANTACALVAHDTVNDLFYVAHSYHASGDDPQKHIQRIETALGGRKVDLSFGGANSEQSLRDSYSFKGHPILRPLVHGAGSVEVGINAIYRLIRERRLKVFDTEVGLIDQLLSYSYKVDNDDRVTDLVEDKAMYHRLDALRYVLVSIADGGNSISVSSRVKHEPDEEMDEDWGMPKSWLTKKTS